MGKLVVVATPIGNRGDLSPRALEALGDCDVIAAEDTRHTGQLMAAFGVKKPYVSYHEHNRAAREAGFLARLEAGQTVALVSDAGTPGVCDPGQEIVAAAIAAGHEVTMVPGPCAAVMALVLSGLDTSCWVFEGFLPTKGRAARLTTLAAEGRTIVLYEAPHRLSETLGQLAETCGAERRGAVARELTKMHEEVRRGSLAELAAWAAEGVRGECIIVFEGAVARQADDEQILAAYRAASAHAPPKAAAAAVAAIAGVSANYVYQVAVKGK